MWTQRDRRSRRQKCRQELLSVVADRLCLFNHNCAPWLLFQTPYSRCHSAEAGGHTHMITTLALLPTRDLAMTSAKFLHGARPAQGQGPNPPTYSLFQICAQCHRAEEQRIQMRVLRPALGQGQTVL